MAESCKHLGLLTVNPRIRQITYPAPGSPGPSRPTVGGVGEGNCHLPNPWQDQEQWRLSPSDLLHLV